ncbi:MAG TPA: glutamate synthase [Firmicutes bacterium]|nr:glutamate synthase [Bacillota bacterium]
MMLINASHLDYVALNESIRKTDENCELIGCLGQRYIAAGMAQRSIRIDGVPGNALGAYLNGATITVYGNAQDAVGDTMNDGRIIVHGNVGDAVGYAMRSGEIFVKGNAGYRAGIHMKEYRDKVPVMVIGGVAGSFLGEYQAGGKIIVLGLGRASRPIISNFPCTGMHGGKVYLRSDCRDVLFPDQVTVRSTTDEDLADIFKYVSEYCNLFGYDVAQVMNAAFTVVTPNSNNPYKQMYVAN